MPELTRTVEFLVGCALVITTWLSVLRTVLAPGEGSSRLMRGVLRVGGGAAVAAARRLGEPSRSALLQLTGPVVLFVVLVCWLVGQLAGFGLVLMSLTVWRSPAAAVAILAGERHTGSAAGVATLAAWASGVLLLLVFTVHLVRFVDAYGRRERVVAQVAAQASHIRDAELLIAAHARAGSADHLDALLAGWTGWFTDVQCTHRAYPALVFCRSTPRTCWLDTTMIMLDAAALLDAIAPRWAPPSTRGLLRAGIECLRALAGQLGIPPPATATSLQGREEIGFAETMRIAATAGLPVERGVDGAWHAFQHWRVAYAPYCVRIGEHVLCEPAADEREEPAETKEVHR